MVKKPLTVLLCFLPLVAAYTTVLVFIPFIFHFTSLVRLAGLDLKVAAGGKIVFFFQ